MLSHVTTFRKLKEEACKHWKIDRISRVSLRNRDDREWRDDALVQSGLNEETGVRPMVRLHIAIALEKNNMLGKTKPILKKSNAPGATTANAVSFNTTTAALDTTAIPLQEDARTTRARVRKLEKQAREAAVMELSPIFHDPEYASKMSFDYKDSVPETRKRYVKTRMAKTCMWLLFWALTVSLCIATMVVRFSTGGAFASLADVAFSLGTQPFEIPLLNVVREFGGVNDFTDQLSIARSSIVRLIQPYKRMIALEETTFWVEQVLGPSLGLAVVAIPGVMNSNTGQKLVNGQQVLLGNLFVQVFNVETTTCFPSLGGRNATCPNGVSCALPFLVGSLHATPLSIGVGQIMDGKFSLQGKLGMYQANQAISKSLTSLDGPEWESLKLSLQALGNATRALSFHFNLLNLNLGWIVSVSCLAEVGPEKLLLTTIQTKVAPLSVYAKYSNQYLGLIITGDLFLISFVTFAFWKWILDPKYRTAKGVRRTMITIWNVIIVFLYLLAWTQLIIGIVYETYTAKNLPTSAPFVINVDNLHDTLTAYLGISSVVLVLLIFTLFKFLQGDEKTSILYQTFHRASRPLAAVTLLFILATSSMTLWAHLAWGPSLLEWSIIPQAVAILTGMTFGAPVDFASLRETQNTLLFIAFFFLIWVGMVILILIQLVGAIVLDAYFEVRAVTQDHLLDDTEMTDVGSDAGGGAGFWIALVLAPLAWLNRDSLAKRKIKTKAFLASIWRSPGRIFTRRSNSQDGGDAGTAAEAPQQDNADTD